MLGNGKRISGHGCPRTRKWHQKRRETNAPDRSGTRGVILGTREAFCRGTAECCGKSGTLGPGTGQKDKSRQEELAKRRAGKKKSRQDKMSQGASIRGFGSYWGIFMFPVYVAGYAVVSLTARLQGQRSVYAQRTVLSPSALVHPTCGSSAVRKSRIEMGRLCILNRATERISGSQWVLVASCAPSRLAQFGLWAAGAERRPSPVSSRPAVPVGRRLHCSGARELTPRWVKSAPSSCLWLGLLDRVRDTPPRSSHRPTTIPTADPVEFFFTYSHRVSPAPI